MKNFKKMKPSKLVKPILVVMLLLAVLSSCKKDETSYSGEVRITFTNQPADLGLYISPAENPQVAITDWLKPVSTGIYVQSLNAGNYILMCWSSTYVPSLGFQVQAGKTTVINYDASNDGHVQ